MKKLMFVLVLVLATAAVNAQRTAVKVSDLQKSITDRISKDYAGYVITKADRVNMKNETTFEIVISKGSTSETLVFDKDGKFMNRMALKSGSPEKSSGAHNLAHHKPVSKAKAGK